jgi:exosome complex RNA-binding protein Rrp4
MCLHICVAPVFVLQRRRTAEDELNMRKVFREGDLISVSVTAASATASHYSALLLMHCFTSNQQANLHGSRH